jgi:hypothetical protein
MATPVFNREFRRPFALAIRLIGEDNESAQVLHIGGRTAAGRLEAIHNLIIDETITCHVIHLTAERVI